MKILINNGSGLIDYTNFVDESSISIQDSINVPTLVSFTLYNFGDDFIVPKHESYFKIVSEKYFSGPDPLVLATGFITNDPEMTFQGLAQAVGKTLSFQSMKIDVKGSSDEWLLNVKAVTFVPTFMNQGIGQILSSLAETLAPGFFDVSNVNNGDIVPSFDYDVSKTWSDMAKSLADGARYRYKCIDKKIYFKPFDDGPLGVVYDETQPQSAFYPAALQTGILTVPPVNDAIVIGDIEPQRLREDYFIGDGESSNFPFHHKTFHAASSQLLYEQWNETDNQFQTQLWRLYELGAQVQPGSTEIFQLSGALNVIYQTPGSILSDNVIVGINGIELGGSNDLEHGEFRFIDKTNGILGGLYPRFGSGDNQGLTKVNCIAGFEITSDPSFVLNAAGVAGISIQPVYNGVNVGTPLLTKTNCSYVLQTIISNERYDRYVRIYRSLYGDEFGGYDIDAPATITFMITEINIQQQIQVQEGIIQYTPVPAPLQAVVTQFVQTNATVPAFAAYAPVNITTANIVVTETSVNETPQGALYVRSLVGPSGPVVGTLPVLPEDITDEVHYLLGDGFVNQTATLGQGNGGVDQLQFYIDTIPTAGARIRIETWESGTSIGRVRDPANVAASAILVGDDGVRLAIMTSLSPLPRTSEECEQAAAAAIKDRTLVQYQGSYNCYDYFFSPGIATTGYPVPGRSFYVTALPRGLSNEKLFVNSIQTKVLSLRDEVLQFSINFGPDLYLEKLLARFTNRTENLLLPKETANPPNYVALADLGTTFIDDIPALKVIDITGASVHLDVGSAPSTGVEIRRTDTGWGDHVVNVIGTIATQQFTLPRYEYDQTWYFRLVNNGKYSRHTKAIRIVAPRTPLPPTGTVDASDLLHPILNLDFGTNDIRDVYGLEIRLPSLTPGGDQLLLQTLTISLGTVLSVVSYDNLVSDPKASWKVNAYNQTPQSFVFSAYMQNFGSNMQINWSFTDPSGTYNSTNLEIYIDFGNGRTSSNSLTDGGQANPYGGGATLNVRIGIIPKPGPFDFSLAVAVITIPFSGQTLTPTYIASGKWQTTSGLMQLTPSSAPSYVLATPAFDPTVVNEVTGQFQVVSSAAGEDPIGFIGFVFCQQDSNNFYLFDWAAETQTGPSSQSTTAGMRVKKMQGGQSALSIAEFWSPVDVGFMHVLYSNAVAWQLDINYSFSVTTRSGGFDITIADVASGNQLASFSVSDTTFTSGMFGLYSNRTGGANFVTNTMIQFLYNTTLLQRPIVAPQDLNYTYTNLSKSRVLAFDCYFFNLMWEYSDKFSLDLSSALLSSKIDNLAVNDNTQICSWDLVQGTPTGYHVLITGDTATPVTSSSGGLPTDGTEWWQHCTQTPASPNVIGWEFVNKAWRTNPSGTPSVTDAMVVTGFGFAIPANATIIGIQVVYGFISQTASTAIVNSVKLKYNGADFGTAKTPNTPVSNNSWFPLFTNGDKNDMWGAVITPAIVNSPTFGFSLSATFDTIRLFLAYTTMVVTYIQLVDNGVQPTYQTDILGASVTSFKLPDSDFYNARTITVTPYDPISDGEGETISHAKPVPATSTTTSSDSSSSSVVARSAVYYQLGTTGQSTANYVPVNTNTQLIIDDGYIHVRELGAVGDNVANDRLAIQKALDLAAGLIFKSDGTREPRTKVIIPSDMSCSIDTAILLPSNVEFRLDGALSITGAGSVISNKASVSLQQDTFLRMSGRGRIYGTVSITNCQSFVISDLQFLGSIDHLIISNAGFVAVTNLLIGSAAYAKHIGISLDTITGGYVTHNSLQTCSTGILWTPAALVTFGTNIFSNCTTNYSPALLIVGARTSVLVTTASLADSASATGAVAMARTIEVVRVTSDKAAWIRLYETAAARAADAARDIATVQSVSGMIIDLYLDGSTAPLDFILTPAASGANEDDGSQNIYYNIVNKSGTATVVNVTFSFTVLQV